MGALRTSLAGLQSTETTLPYADYKTEVLDSLLSVPAHKWHLSEYSMCLQLGCPTRTGTGPLSDTGVGSINIIDGGELHCPEVAFGPRTEFDPRRYLDISHNVLSLITAKNTTLYCIVNRTHHEFDWQVSQTKKVCNKVHYFSHGSDLAPWGGAYSTLVAFMLHTQRPQVGISAWLL